MLRSTHAKNQWKLQKEYGMSWLVERDCFAHVFIWIMEKRSSSLNNSRALKKSGSLRQNKSSCYIWIFRLAPYAEWFCQQRDLSVLDYGDPHCVWCWRSPFPPRFVTFFDHYLIFLPMSIVFHHNELCYGAAFILDFRSLFCCLTLFCSGFNVSTVRPIFPTILMSINAKTF